MSVDMGRSDDNCTNDAGPNGSEMRRNVLQNPVSILMPVCNEADIIEGVVGEWLSEVLDHLPSGSELVFDDSSTDGTEQILAQLAERDSRIRYYFSPRDNFFNAAMRLYRQARCPLIFFTDSDGQYVPADFWKVASALGDHHLAHGYKVGRKDPFYRIIASSIFNGTVYFLFGSHGKDVNSAFRLIRSELLDAVLDQIHCLPMMPNAEMYIRAEAQGFRIINVPVRHRARRFGKSRSLLLRRFGYQASIAFRGLLAIRAELRAPQAQAKTGLLVE
jgi:glycosyltransferase involved in cell wall biosynthesis